GWPLWCWEGGCRQGNGARGGHLERTAPAGTRVLGHRPDARVVEGVGRAAVVELERRSELVREGVEVGVALQARRRRVGTGGHAAEQLEARGRVRGQLELVGRAAGV